MKNQIGPLCIIFYLLLVEQSVKNIIYLIVKKSLNHTKPNYIFLAFYSAKYSMPLF